MCSGEKTFSFSETQEINKMKNAKLRCFFLFLFLSCSLLVIGNPDCPFCRKGLEDNQMVSKGRFRCGHDAFFHAECANAYRLGDGTAPKKTLTCPQCQSSRSSKANSASSSDILTGQKSKRKSTASKVGDSNKKTKQQFEPYFGRFTPKPVVRETLLPNVHCGICQKSILDSRFQGVKVFLPCTTDQFVHFDCVFDKALQNEEVDKIRFECPICHGQHVVSWSQIYQAISRENPLVVQAKNLNDDETQISSNGEEEARKAWDGVFVPMFYDAIEKCDGQTTKILLESAVSPNVQNSEGHRPLHFSIDWGCEEIFRLLISKGALIDGRDDEEKTALHHAAAFDDSDNFIKALLQMNVDVDAKDSDEKTPLHYCTESQFVVCIYYLLKYKASVSLTDSEGNTALHFAVEQVEDEFTAFAGESMIPRESIQLKIVQLLLNAGADVDALNDDSVTPLMIASIEGSADVLKLLVAKSRNLELQDHTGYTALFYSIQSFRSDKVGLLLEHGANYNHLSVNSQSVFDVATTETMKSFLKESIEKLKESGQVNSRTTIVQEGDT